MKILLVLGIVTSAFWGMTQGEVFSFYFDKQGILNLNSVQSIPTQFYGKYELSDIPKHEVRRAAGEYLKIDESGIYIEKNRLISISRDEVRENSKYRVNKGWLHGVVENDSVPCALDGDNYFFLVPAKTFLFDKIVSSNKLIMVNKETYAMFSVEDNGYFSVVVIKMKAGGLSLNDISFTLKDEKSIEKIEKRKEQTDKGLKTFILTPSKEEWESFVFKICLEQYDDYLKITE
ncbi:hypothetical protein K6119_14580 [Paracrocinitomix mangrovi]|uniref:hypothetical protein n=1 Tax=Paracrocinitomix mangrovi TaxID=2862509 RepID=UPI001C8E19D4|nr:hypothetical protein [Paracrocinitomix mangrovi]UKN00958.1 hypothetical protein K6119_14580 [Paracrocinitomix mangrovi]